MKLKQDGERKSNLAQLFKCSKDLIYVTFIIREQLQELKITQSIKDFKESRENLPGGFLFTIKLKTLEEYELKISFSDDPKKERIIFRNIDSRRDKISIHGSVDPYETERFIKKFLLKYLFKRVRGFNTEYFARIYLESVIKLKKSDLLTSVEKTQTNEDRKGKDFVLGCIFGGQRMLVHFNLKNNKEAVRDARSKSAKIPTIFTNEQEIKNNPEKFLERIHELIVKNFRAGTFGLNVGAEAQDMHIV